MSALALCATFLASPAGQASMDGWVDALDGCTFCPDGEIREFSVPQC